MKETNTGVDSLLLVGCGKMGSALLKGWLASGLRPESVSVIEPCPSDWLRDQGVNLDAELAVEEPDCCVMAVKPQVMGSALEAVVRLGNRRTMFLSIAAGTRLEYFERMLGCSTPIVRAMPNTPAAIGCGISAYIGNSHASEQHLQIADNLLSAAGETVRISSEALLDVVTGVSGSGPAYVFYLIECLANAGVKEGLPEDVSMQLAIATAAGAGNLALSTRERPEQLRINVTSPGGTTAAALRHLMDDDNGLAQLMERSVKAAVERGRELGADDG